MKTFVTPLQSQLVSVDQLDSACLPQKKDWIYQRSQNLINELRWCERALDSPDRGLECYSSIGDGTNLELVVKDLNSHDNLSKPFNSEGSLQQALVKNWLFLTPRNEEFPTIVIDWRSGRRFYLNSNYTVIVYFDELIILNEVAFESGAEYMLALDVRDLQEVWRQEGFFGDPYMVEDRGLLIRGKAQQPFKPKDILEVVDAKTGDIIKSISMRFGKVYARKEKFLYFSSTACVGELELDSFAVRKIEISFREAKDFQVLDNQILFQVPGDGGGDGSLYLQDIQSTEIVGQWAWPSKYEWARASRIQSIGNGYYGIRLRNGEENKGWVYWRYFVFKPEELMEADPQVEYEPLKVSFAPEKDENGDNRYRVSISDDCDDLVTYIWQMEVGAQSCADAHGFSGLVEDKPFDEDFAGEVILDCQNIPFDGDKEALGAALVESGRSFCSLYQILDAVEHEPIRFRCEF